MARKKTAKADEPAGEVVESIKGFDADLKCRGFQFEIGRTYDCGGAVVMCSRGFHAVDPEQPFHVWDFYPVVGNDGRLTRYAAVKQSRDLLRARDDAGRGVKIASGSITIQAELSLPDFVRRAVDAVIALTKGKGDDLSGDSAQIGSSGHSAQIGSSGDYARIGSSGHYAQIGSSGDYARIGSSGGSARIGSSGHSAQIGSSGDYAQIGSSGGSARIGSSGDYAQIGSSGDYARIGSSGDYAQIGSSGDYARIGSSGGSARIVAEGKDAVIACAASATVTAGPGGAICIPYSDGTRTRFALGYVGEDGIEAGIAYLADAATGKLIAA